MQQVSQSWIAAQQQTLVPESFVEVTLTVGDPDAQIDATASSNGEQTISNVASVVQGPLESPELLATTELNMWGLSGSFEVLPSGPADGGTGFIGNLLSGPDGEFSVTPTITISLPKVYSALIPGVTVVWSETYGEWATSFRVTAYNGSSQVAQTTVTQNTSVQSVVNLDIQNYNRITIEILSWCLPSRWARVEQVTLGILQVYGKPEIMSYQHKLSVDPLSGELPTSEIDFEVSNLNGQYNPDNPQGVEQYLMERQEITARYGYLLNGAVEWIAAGTFFMSEWDCPQNGITASFKARDAQEYMTDLYSGPDSGTLYAIASSAFRQADMPLLADGSNRWVIDNSLALISAASGADLSSNTIKEVLQLCANAACCVLYQDRAGVFHIEPLAAGNTSYPINQFNSYKNAEVALTKQLRAVDINSGQYVLSVGSVGDTQQVNNPLISAARAPTVAQWVADYLTNRRTLSGEFRADPRLDPLDRVVNTNSFATSNVLVTSITYTYNGAFRGTYEGRAGA